MSNMITKRISDDNLAEIRAFFEDFGLVPSNLVTDSMVKAWKFELKDKAMADTFEAIKQEEALDFMRMFNARSKARNNSKLLREDPFSVELTLF